MKVIGETMADSCRLALLRRYFSQFGEYTMSLSVNTTYLVVASFAPMFRASLGVRYCGFETRVYCLEVFRFLSSSIVLLGEPPSTTITGTFEGIELNRLFNELTIGENLSLGETIIVTDS